MLNFLYRYCRTPRELQQRWFRAVGGSLSVRTQISWLGLSLADEVTIRNILEKHVHMLRTEYKDQQALLKEKLSSLK